MMEYVDTIICNTFLFTIPELEMQIAYGNVVEDLSGRFSPGVYILTKEVVKKEVLKNTLLTRDHEYLVKGEAKEVTLSLKEYQSLFLGINPAEVLLLLATFEAKHSTQH